jgi:Na+/citrate or Na+/malate symporter
MAAKVVDLLAIWAAYVVKYCGEMPPSLSGQGTVLSHQSSH